MRVRVLPGEQARACWMDAGKVPVENYVRKLMGFVMTLSHSRRIFVRFYYEAGMSFFLHGRVCAFNAFGGVPRRLIYDNLKSAVVARRHVLARYNDALLELAGQALRRDVLAGQGGSFGPVPEAGLFQFVDITVRQLAADQQAAQRVSQPSGPVSRPLENLSESGRLRVRACFAARCSGHSKLISCVQSVVSAQYRRRVGQRDRQLQRSVIEIRIAMDPFEKRRQICPYGITDSELAFNR